MAGQQGIKANLYSRVEWCPEHVQRVEGQYVLRVPSSLSDDSFYVGSTKNVQDRVHAHNSGRGATYTFKRRPVRLMYAEAFETEALAMKRERQLKRWSTAKKQSLIDGNIERLRRLSKRRV